VNSKAIVVDYLVARENLRHAIREEQNYTTVTQRFKELEEADQELKDLVRWDEFIERSKKHGG